MGLQDVLLGKKERKQDNEENVKKNKICLEKDSIQYNAQDLDQEQRVDVNPIQNLHVYVNNKETDYSSQIIGTTFMEDTKKVAANVNILLYFGYDTKHPIYKTNSDNNGNFIIEDLPAGFYTLTAKLGELLKYESPYIKVLPCQKVSHTVFLKFLI